MICRINVNQISWCQFITPNNTQFSSNHSMPATHTTLYFPSKKLLSVHLELLGWHRVAFQHDVPYSHTKLNRIELTTFNCLWIIMCNYLKLLDGSIQWSALLKEYTTYNTKPTRIEGIIHWLITRAVIFRASVSPFLRWALTHCGVDRDV